MAKKCNCKELKKSDWDEKEFIWKNKVFYKTKYKEFMHIPLNFGKVITKAFKEIEKNKIETDGFTLSGEENVFSSSLMIPLKTKSDKLPTETMSGSFMTKLFEGQYKDAGDWAKEMTNYVHGKQKEVAKLWFWYAICPKCAKKMGKVQTVIFAETK
ncbi:MAG: hydrolase [Patescibacteria group bacterium]